MPETPSALLHQLFSEEWEARLKADPFFATFVGDRRYNDRLQSLLPADFDQRLSTLLAFLQRLEAIDRSQIDPTDRVNYDVFGRMLKNDIASLKYRSYLLPISRDGGFHSLLADVVQLTPFDTLADYRAYISRLYAVKVFFEGQIALMRAGIGSGYLPSRPTLEGVASSLGQHVVRDPKESSFYKPFTTFPGSIPLINQNLMAAEGQEAILRSVIPAFAMLRSFILDEYYPASRETVAVSGLPDGEAYYAHLVKMHTTTDLTPAQIHSTGLAEVKRIRSEMNDVIQGVGFQGSFADFIQFLRSAPRFYPLTPEALLKETAYILKRMDGELPRLFKKLPRTPYGIKPIPDYIAPYTTTAYYFPPPGDASRGGFYYVNTHDLPSRPLYEMEALSLHEAVPGHHLQIALQMELENIPDFRRFLSFTAYVEGWALYAERLGIGLGFYEDPYSNFGRLTYEMWRACRLVVDTGMHAMGWTRQQAIDFMAENTALTLLNIANEVDRYIATPAQALAYKIGELKIRALRAFAEESLGPAFDLRAFHDLLLGSGPIPLDILESSVHDWVAASRQI